MPEEGKNIIEYKDIAKQQKLPFCIYADTECILTKVEDGKNKNISDELNKNGANRTDSPKHNATCLKTSDELKLKYSDKWIKHVRHMNGTRFEKRNKSVRSSFKRHKFESFRFQSRKLSIKESSLPLSSLEKDRFEGKQKYLI